MNLKLELLILASLFVCAYTSSCPKSDWTEYKEKYNKNYETEEEDERHYIIYCDAVTKIADHNSQFRKGEVDVTYELNENKYTDLTIDEQNKLYEKITGHKRMRGSKNVQ